MARQKKERINKAGIQEKHSGFYSFLGFVVGFIFAFSIIYVLSYSFGFVAGLLLGSTYSKALYSILIFVAAIYAVIFVKALAYGRDMQSHFWEWFGIGGLGLLFGLIIDAIVQKGNKKGITTKHNIFFIAWLITTLVSYAFFAFL
jgi:hypothetical protein